MHASSITCILQEIPITKQLKFHSLQIYGAALGQLKILLDQYSVPVFGFTRQGCQHFFRLNFKVFKDIYGKFWSIFKVIENIFKVLMRKFKIIFI